MSDSKTIAKALFEDEFDSLRIKLRDAQEQRNIADARLREAQDATRAANNRAGNAETEQARLEAELDSAKRTVSDANRRAEAAALAETYLAEQTNRADGLDAELAKTKEKLAATTAALKAARLEVTMLTDTALRDAEKVAEAVRTLSALRAREEADSVLSSVRL